ncbi:MAG: bifunctional heptose 7-phosphate kinase/heptose 1-phosphate adenyltransferase [Parachlamydiales bacterium]
MVALSPRRILLVGDLALDRYTHGTVSRISPEAPVPILHATRVEERAGMAGNVALGLAALHQEVVLLARVGDDAACEAICSSLEGIDLALEKELGWETPIKHRLMAGQQLLRVDTERIRPLTPKTEIGICSKIERLLDDIDAVAISDYGKGFCTPTLLAALLSAAKKRSIPTLVDPKGRDFTRYAGATLIKPNHAEACHAANLDPHTPLEEVAAALHSQIEMNYLVVTRSEKGISIFPKEGGHDNVPATPLQVRDVTGAGDTVLAVLTAAVASGLSLREGCQLANQAASLAVQRLGCVPITLEELTPLASSL